MAQERKYDPAWAQQNIPQKRSLLIFRVFRAFFLVLCLKAFTKESVKDVQTGKVPKFCLILDPAIKGYDLVRELFGLTELDPQIISSFLNEFFNDAGVNLVKVNEQGDRGCLLTIQQINVVMIHCKHIKPGKGERFFFPESFQAFENKFESFEDF